MKKNNFLALGAFAFLLASCGGSDIQTNVKLETTADTLAYAYGVELGDKGLAQYLSQLELMTDTTQVRMSYMQKIQAETDPAKQATLQKEVEHKIDSINKANAKNLAELLSGIKEAVNAGESKSAYLRGIEIGNQIKQVNKGLSKQVYGAESTESVDINKLLAGVISTLKKEKPLLENAGAIVQIKMQELEEQEAKKTYAANIEQGQKFLQENKAKEGVVTLPSGLQYKIVKEGTGAKPSLTDKVKAHYQGSLLDGTIFDSSIQRGKPEVLGLNQVIPGWTEALQLMPVGSKWILYIPSDLAYGARQAGQITPYSTLTFEIELLSIEK